MRTVAHIITELDVGGAEKQLVTILPHLQKLFKNHVICLMGKGAVGAELEGLGVPVSYANVSSYADPFSVSKTVRALRAIHADVVITYLAYADLVGRVASRITNTPLTISNKRNTMLENALINFPYIATRRLVDQWIVQTNAAKKEYMKFLRIPDAAIRVIPNAVQRPQVCESRSAVRERLGIPISSTLFVCLATLKPGKGQEILVSSFENIARRYPDTELLFVGSGPLRSQLEVTVHRKKMDSRVYFSGHVDNPWDLLNAADVFVLATESEGMSNALLEAMASGLPCITSDIDVNKDVIKHGDNGILFPACDEYALSSAMAQLLDDKQLRTRIARSARQYIQSNHTPEHIAALWEELLDQ